MSETAVRNQIRHWRLTRGEMTQVELARLCGVTRQTIIALEAGKYSPSLELAFKLAHALGRSLEEVFQYAHPVHNEAKNKN
jgi:putative transcriptional regulator